MGRLPPDANVFFNFYLIGALVDCRRDPTPPQPVGRDDVRFPAGPRRIVEATEAPPFIHLADLGKYWTDVSARLSTRLAESNVGRRTSATTMSHS